jgi:hypothetical protein
MVLQKSNLGHINDIFKYKTLKFLRSYSSSKGQERVKQMNMTYMTKGSLIPSPFGLLITPLLLLVMAWHVPYTKFINTVICSVHGRARC